MLVGGSSSSRGCCPTQRSRRAPRRWGGRAPVGARWWGPHTVCRPIGRVRLVVGRRDSSDGWQRGVVLIGGEPGIGKTRLAEEVAGGAADRGMAVLVGHSYERTGASPYVALIELLESALAAARSPEDFRRVLGDAAPELARVVPRVRRVFPDLPAPLDMPAEQERLYLFSCLSEVLVRLCGEKPLLLVLDDLQWADEPTLLFLDY